MTPTRVLWWPEGRLDEPPEEWRAPEDTNAPRLEGISPEGSACLTFHAHDAGFSYQQNRVLVGQISPRGDGTLILEVERLLGDWSLSENKLSFMFDFMFRKGRQLRPRLKAESARRGQPVPKVRFPEEVASRSGSRG